MSLAILYHSAILSGKRFTQASEDRLASSQIRMLCLASTLALGFNFGVTCDLQFFFQFQYQWGIATGVYIGAGASAGVGYSDGPIQSGWADIAVAEAGAGWGASKGGQITADASGASIQKGAGAKIGAGAGIFAGAGVGKQWTAASEPLLPYLSSSKPGQGYRPGNKLWSAG